MRVSNMAPRESGLTSTWSQITREQGKPTQEEMQMTAQRAGAASHARISWEAIDWQAAHQNVRRLQARIVKAEQEGKRGKVKALQRLLTHSFSGKVLAVRRVTENQGKKTAGVDKILWDTPARKASAVGLLRQRGYQPQPLRRVYIPKKHGKNKHRALGIPTMRDRAMQALYLLALEPIAETTADPNSYGFRPGRSTADAIEQCFTVLGKGKSPQWILEGDIRACFDKISHDWLVAHIPMDKVILRKWLKAGYMDRSILYPTDEGTPQGGIASPALANMTLDGLERALLEAFPRKPSHGLTAMVNLSRYADDFVITGRSQELLENEVKPLVQRFLSERGLELSEEKTHITHIGDGFDFLGQNIRKYRDGKRQKLLIKPSKENVRTFLSKVREIIKTNQALPAGTLVARLNPVIRGWALYHRHVVSAKVFKSVDDAIYQALKQWARRRHPKKPHAWVTKKYFHTDGGDNGVFFGDDEGKTRNLVNAASIPIRRHIKVKGAANPFDPAWEVYFEERLGVKMEDTLVGRRQLLHLWKEQNGICPICHRMITRITGWHNHHRIWRSKGGPDTAENRVLVHPTCHSQIHSLGLYVEKPRPARGVK
jgi:RNA-directed DNA polymerase